MSLIQRKPQIVEAVLSDGHEMVIKSPYHPAITEAWKSAGGRFVGTKGHPYHKWWRFKASAMADVIELIPQIMKAANQAVYDRPDRLHEAFRAAMAQADPALLSHGLTVALYPITSGGVTACAPFHSGFNALCIAEGGTYVKGLRGWYLADMDPDDFRSLVLSRLGFDAEQVQIIEGAFELHTGGISGTTEARLQPTFGICAKSGSKGISEAQEAIYQLATVSPRMPTPSTADARLLANLELDDYQVTGAIHLLSHSSNLLADDMGLGKTRQAVAAAEVARAGGTVLVTCPASLVYNWAAEIKKVISSAKVELFEPKADTEWVICNFEQLERMRKHAPRMAVLIVDEVHYLKQPSIGRTRLVFDVAHHIPRRMLLSGTPVINLEADMHTLLRLSGHTLGMLPIRQYKDLFAGTPEQRGKLHQQIDGWMLRRDKSTVLNLPGKRRDYVPLPLTPEVQRAYFELIQRQDMIAIQKITPMRQILELAKIPYVRDRAKGMGAGEKMIVFCEYEESVDQFMAALAGMKIGAVKIVGSMTKLARHKSNEAFQTDPRVRVLVGTSGAAGTGLTLTAANIVVFAGLPWTDALRQQAEDRANRRGQTRVVQVVIPTILQTIDEYVQSILAAKAEMTAQVVEGKLAAAIESNHDGLRGQLVLPMAA